MNGISQWKVPNHLQQLKKKDKRPSLALGPWASKFFPQGLSLHLDKEKSGWDIQNLSDSRLWLNSCCFPRGERTQVALVSFCPHFFGQSDQPQRRWPSDPELLA